MYEAFVRHYAPNGYASFYAGCTKRVGLARAIDICQHKHPTPVEAEGCAENLSEIRNSKKEN